MKKIFKDKGGFDEAGSGRDESMERQRPGRGVPLGPIERARTPSGDWPRWPSFCDAKEPQSPIYLLVERAVTWSRMPFDQLLGRIDQGFERARARSESCWASSHPPE